MTATVEIEKDLAELTKLEAKATRSRVKDFLKLEMRRLHTELVKREEEKKASGEATGEAAASAPSKPQAAQGSTKTYTEIIKNYAWDQSDKFMKLYVTLPGVQSLHKDSITSHFTQQSVVLRVKGLNGRDLELGIARLAEQIDPEASYHKVKTDMVLVMLKKKVESKTWAFVTEKEKLAKQTKSKPPSMDKDADPSAGLMGLLQDMYESGDDEMKRMIKKSMYESQTKRGSEFSM